VVCHDVMGMREETEKVTKAVGHFWLYLLKIGVVGYCQKRSRMSLTEMLNL